MNTNRLPAHVAIVMDGNGRWANARGLSRTEGHRRAQGPLFECIEAAVGMGISVLSVFVFSTENWRRSPDEVRFLMGYNRAVLRSRRAELMEKNVRVLWSGQGSRLRRALLRELRITEKLTRDNTGLTVQLCLNYGGRGEITDAVRQIARDVTLGKLRSSDIDEATVGKYLYQSGLPPVDLIIRTGGESRLSNFLLWHGGAAEVLVTDTMWPDFKGSEMRDACLRFADLSV